MKIHEYQGKAILKKYGVAVPRGTMATTREEAEAAARELLNSGATGVVVKAQIHAGGRGKGGGVKLAKSVEEAGELASKILGMTLVTHQTGPEGRVVRRLADRRDAAHREGTLSRHSGGSRRGQAGFHGIGRGRHGY
jgi:succinyl-CoA synthetase beta subunit